jgi:tRNA(His) 5'-end guanylyltransferase
MSGGEIAFLDIQSVSMIGPYHHAPCFAEFPFSKFARLDFANCIHFDCALTNFSLSAKITQHFLHKMDDEAWHELLNTPTNAHYWTQRLCHRLVSTKAFVSVLRCGERSSA